MARRSLGRLVLVLGSPLFALVLLAALEGTLRLTGIGARQVSQLSYQRIHLPVMVPGRRADGTAVLRTVDPRLPRQSILADKPADGLRVFVFGGSAAAGLGFSPNVTFARHLERLLERALPERTIEVVNLGIVAFSSDEVRELVRDVCEHCEPDLVVVYSGNNEFLEIHAEKYHLSRAGIGERALAALRETRLFRLASGSLGTRAPVSIAEFAASQENLRLTQGEIIEHIEMTNAEIDAVVDHYEGNLEEMTRAAAATGTPVLLMTVASNWKWRGREDLPADWMAALIRDEGRGAPDALEPAAIAREILDRKLEDRSDPEHHEWLFRRAVLNEARGEHEAARADYRAAMNADPHLRRALDSMNARVARVAERSGAALLDTVAALASHAEHGTVGFDELYDYVHFTPRGAVLVGSELFQSLRDMGVVPPANLDTGEYVLEELERLSAITEDFLGARDWLGVGMDLARISDRDLWKYERMLEELDRVLAADPENARALVYRGNARSFLVGRVEDAAADYRAALELGEDPVVRGNLERLLAERGR